MAIGLWSAVASGGAAIGPLIGGVLLEYFWWGSVFLINVPVAVAALLAALVVIPRSEGRSDVGWDLPGSLLILVGLVGLAYAIKEMAMQAPSWPAAAGAAAIGALALFWFARRQRGSAAPLIDLSLFENRGFRVAVLAALVVGVQRDRPVPGHEPAAAARAGLFAAARGAVPAAKLRAGLYRRPAFRLVDAALRRQRRDGRRASSGRFRRSWPVPVSQCRPGSPAALSGALRPGGRRGVGGGLGRHHELRPARARRHGRLDRGSVHRARRGDRHHRAGQHSGRSLLGDSRPAEGSGPSVEGARRHRPGAGGGAVPAGRRRAPC